jgi:alkanesulfonate monooxygenase SsuD/methylene tetrahydromethanopterin reductase-like flavin-dependent oxidoreductase (luciferase family)
MLGLVARYADIWNGWLVYGNSHAHTIPPLRDMVDSACIEHGRDPASLARSVTVRVALSGAIVPNEEPIQGSSANIADELWRLSEQGISHVQILLAPPSAQSLESFNEVLLALDSR